MRGILPAKCPRSLKCSLLRFLLTQFSHNHFFEIILFDHQKQTKTGKELTKLYSSSKVFITKMIKWPFAMSLDERFREFLTENYLMEQMIFAGLVGLCLFIMVFSRLNYAIID